MNFELFFIAAIFAFSLVLVFLNPRKAVYVLLGTSALLHKELFSIYSWNILPIRVVMMAFFIYSAYKIIVDIKNTGFKKVLSDVNNPASLALLVFWILAGLSIAFTRNLTASLFMFVFLTTILVLMLFLMRTINGDKEAVTSYVKAYVLVAFVLSIVSFLQIYIFEKHQFIFGAFWNVPGHTPRVGSLFWDVNHFAGFIVLLLPVVGSLILTSKWKQKIGYFIAGLSIFITLILTNARSGWIAGGVAFLAFCLILIFRKFRHKGLLATFLILMLIAGAITSQYLNKQSPIRREIRQYFHYRIDSFDSHFFLLTGSWQIFEKFPILGGGYGGFFEQFSKTPIAATFFARDPAALNTRVPAHSIWGELLSETGVLGFSAMLVFYSTVTLTLLYAALRLSRKHEYIKCAAMAGSVIGIMTAGIFYSYNTEFFWIILFLYFLYALYCLKDEFGETGAKLWTTIFSHFISNPKFPILILTFISFTLIFPNLGVNHLIPWDEAIYAKVSENMLDKHDYLTLYWKNNSPWFEKPPMYFWLSSLSLSVFPDTEFAMRLPSAIFGFLTVLLVFFFGKRLFGKVAGFIAGLALVTTFHFLYYSRTGMLDVTSAFFITASLFSYYVGVWHEKSRMHLLGLVLSGVFAGLAILTKGVVGFLPLVVVGAYEFATLPFTNPKTIFKAALTGFLRFVIVLLSALLVALPWHLFMYKAYGQEFINKYYVYHVLGRATTDAENKTAPLFWYVEVAKVSMRLWFVALIPSVFFLLYRLIKDKSVRKKILFVFIWTLVVFGAFSYSKSKLVWYIIPLYPALVLIVGYFYSYVLNLMDKLLSKFRYVSSLGLKVAVIYITICISLLYLVSNKGLVYTSDLTGPQALVLKAKDANLGANTMVYVDGIELPLILFYTKGPFAITDFTNLQDMVANSQKEGESLVFITKESRFNKLKALYPAVRYVSSQKGWYLGEVGVNEVP